MEAWSGYATRERADALAEPQRAAAAESGRASPPRLAELDRLNPHEGEEAALADQRALLGAAEKALAEISAARDGIGDGLTGRLAQALRALERARERALHAGVSPEGAAGVRLAEAAAAVDPGLWSRPRKRSPPSTRRRRRFAFEPDDLERAEERLFAPPRRRQRASWA